MTNISQINTDSNWGTEAPKMNQNFQNISTDILKLKNSTTRFKGYHTSEEGLKSKYPAPQSGDYAWVGTPYPGKVYDVANGQWHNTNQDPPAESVDLVNYYTKEEINSITEGQDAKLSKLADTQTTQGEEIEKINAEAVFSDANTEELPQPEQTSSDYATSALQDWEGHNIHEHYATREQLADIKPVVINGNVTNNADNEDLESDVDPETGKAVIHFKDRPYIPGTFRGKGYKILRQNIVTEKRSSSNILIQDMINESNTVYEIRYDFDLGGAEIIVPEGSTLKFEGGCIRNGILVGRKNSSIKATSQKIFSDVKFKGFECIFEADWFVDALSSNLSDFSQDAFTQLEQMFNSGISKIHFTNGRLYYTSKTINIQSKIEILGDTFINTPQNAQCIIFSDYAGAIIHYIHKETYSFSDRVSFSGIKIKSVYETFDKNIPIVRVTTHKGLWGVYINLIIEGKAIKSREELGELVTPNMNGLLIEGIGDNSYISFIRIKGYIASFVGIIVKSDSWITDCIIDCETSCVKGGVINASPLIIRNSHQPNVYYLESENKESYFECAGVVYNQGVIWDNYVGETYKTAYFPIKCSNSIGNGNNLYPNIVTDIDGVNGVAERNNLFASLMSIFTTKDINLNVKIGNSSTFDDVSYGNDRIVNFESILNINNEPYRNLNTLGKYYDYYEPVHIDETLSSQIKTWEKTFVEYKFELKYENNHNLYIRNSEVSNVAVILSYKDSEDNTIYEYSFNKTISANSDGIGITIPGIISNKIVVRLLFTFEKAKSYFYILYGDLLPLPVFNVSGNIKNNSSALGCITKLPIVAKKIISNTDNDETDIFGYKSYPNILGSFSKILPAEFYIVCNKNASISFDCSYVIGSTSYLAFTRFEILVPENKANIIGGVNSIVLEKYNSEESSHLAVIKVLFTGANRISINKIEGREIEVLSKNPFLSPVKQELSIKKLPSIINDSQEYPSLTNQDSGYFLYDKSKSKPYWWNEYRWLDSNGIPINVKSSGNFSNNPAASTGIPIGFQFFCTDKQTEEGKSNGIIIYHKGGDVWVDALGRVIS